TRSLQYGCAAGIGFRAGVRVYAHPSFEFVDRRPQWSCLPFVSEPGKASPAGEQFLHCAELDLPLLGDELLQRLDQDIRIPERTGNRLLFRLCRRQGDVKGLDDLSAEILLATCIAQSTNRIVLT